MRISDWSSDVCSSDLVTAGLVVVAVGRDADKLQQLAQRHDDMVIPCVADIASDASIAVIGEQIKGRTVAMVVHAPGVPVAGGVLEVSTDAINACCNIKAAGFLRLVRAADSALRREIGRASWRERVCQYV